jgi:hypothetical protein
MKKQLLPLFAFAAIAANLFGMDPDETKTSGNRIVSGSCRVNLGPYIQKQEDCDFLTEDGTVPEGSRLLIEHISAACATTSERPIHTVSLITKTTQDVRGVANFVPMTLQASSINGLRYVAAQAVNLYAGERTSVALFARTWEFAPAGETTCLLSFHGVLRPASK